MKIEWNRVTWYSKLLAVIVGLFTIALGFYFTQQYQEIKNEKIAIPYIVPDKTHIDTSNWKTYKNEKYGFEFKYPSKHQINTYSPNGVLSVSVTDDITDVATGDGACSSVSPEIYQKEKENIEKGIAKSETSFGISKIIQIGNGRKALYTIDTCQGVAEDDKPARMIVRMELFDDNKLISIGFSGLNSSKKIKVQDVYEVAKQLIDGTYNGSEQRLIDEFDQILSTFKFTKATSTAIDTSNWKTYKNEKYGFEFKYPAGVKVSSGTHYGGGIQLPGEVQFAVSFPSHRTDGPPGFEIFTFDVEPTDISSNDDLFQLKSSEITNNQYVRDIWNVSKQDFLNMGQVVMVSWNPNEDSHESYCKSYGTLSGSVFLIRSPYLFTFDDYRCENWPEWVKEVMNTFKFTDASKSVDASSDQKISANCGFHVTNLTPNQAVTFPLVVEGVIDNSDYRKAGCAWGMFEGTGGSAQLYVYDIDGKGKGWQQIGAPVPIFVENWATTTTKFKLTIGNDQMGLLANTKLKIIFTEEDAKGIANPDTFELPLMIGNSSVAGISNWKTYKNEEYGFEINYPNSMSVQNSDNGMSLLSVDKQRKIDIKVESIEPGDDCRKTAWAADTPNITIDNKTFVGVSSGLKDEPYYGVLYCTTRDGFDYMITSHLFHESGGSNNFPQGDATLNQIISTFKFTK